MKSPETMWEAQSFETRCVRVTSATITRNTARSERASELARNAACEKTLGLSAGLLAQGLQGYVGSLAHLLWRAQSFSFACI